MPIFIKTQVTLLGHIRIAEQNGCLTELFFDGETVPDSVVFADTPLLNQAFEQLHAYLAGELRQFALPLAPQGTPFMQTVWQALLNIPYGQTASYKDIAIAIGKPTAARAVGMANNKNPLAIFIPCHRVIGCHGQLVGYSAGLDIKRFLLALEQHSS